MIAQVTVPQNAYIAADLQLTKGWCLRELDEVTAADDAFRSATIDGQIIDQARKALDEPSFRIVTTDAETIATRTDKWDPATETSRAERAAAELATERDDVLVRAQARIDELIGLDRRQRADRGVAHRNSDRPARRRTRRVCPRR